MRERVCGSGLSPLLAMLALVRGRGLRRDCVSGLYGGFGVGGGGVFARLLVISVLLRGWDPARDCVSGLYGGVGVGGGVGFLPCL